MALVRCVWYLFLLIPVFIVVIAGIATFLFGNTAGQAVMVLPLYFVEWLFTFLTPYPDRFGAMVVVFLWGLFGFIGTLSAALRQP